MLVAGVVFAATATAQPGDAASLRALGLGGYAPKERPPGFTALTTEGGRLSLSGLRGKVVLLTFWATWCQPCRDEMPLFERLHRDLGREGLVVVGVNPHDIIPRQ